MSGVSKERVTLWSGCIGLTALAGFLGQRPKWDGATPSPSGEPTTLERSGEVIVGYIQGKPCQANHDNGVPLKTCSLAYMYACGKDNSLHTVICIYRLSAAFFLRILSPYLKLDRNAVIVF